MSTYTFRRSDRLQKRRDFTAVFKNGHKFSSRGLSLWVCRHREPTLGPRIGLAITKACGNAVARNRIKRLLREVFRLNKAALPAGADLVFYSRTPFPRARYQTIEPIVKELWQKAKLV